MGGGRSASPPNEHIKDVVLFVTCSLALCLWLLLFLLFLVLYLLFVLSLSINFSRLEGGMGAKGLHKEGGGGGDPPPLSKEQGGGGR